MRDKIGSRRESRFGHLAVNRCKRRVSQVNSLCRQPDGESIAGRRSATATRSVRRQMFRTSCLNTRATGAWGQALRPLSVNLDLVGDLNNLPCS